MQDSAPTTTTTQPPKSENDLAQLFDKLKARQFSAELLATFLLVLTFEALTERVRLIGADETLASLWLFFGAAGMGAMVAVLVYMHEWISGAHLNPAVSFGVMFRFNLARKGPLLIYILMQLLAAAGASLLYNYFFAHPTTMKASAHAIGMIFAAKKNKNASKDGEGEEQFVVPDLTIVFVAEFLFTFLLTTAYFLTIYTRQNRGNQYYGAVIGLVYMVAIIVVGPASGGLLNPAFWFGTIVQRYVFDKPVVIGWIYPVAQLSGAFAAVLLQKWGFGDNCDIVDCNNPAIQSQMGKPLSLYKYVRVPTAETPQTAQTGVPGGACQDDTERVPISHQQLKDSDFFFKKYHHPASVVRSAEDLPAGQQRAVPNTPYKFQQ